MRLIPIASGSHANATAIVDDGLVVVVDAGIQRKEILGKLVELGVLTLDRPEPDALLISHAHSDHARFAKQWPSKGTPVFATQRTLEKLKITGVAAEHWTPIVLDNAVITAAPTSHDCVGSVCWRISGATGTAVIATDLGHIPKSLLPVFRGATHVLLEANHHSRLLEACSYASPLKHRVAGDLGHLSNRQACEFISTMPDTIRHLYLGHISRVANDPRLVELEARLALVGKEFVELEVVS